MFKSTFDRIYYDIVIPYNPNSDNYQKSYAIFQQQLNQPLVMNPQDFSLAITRFTIPTANIPIFIADIADFANDPLETKYSVTMSYNGIYSPQTFVQYVSSQPGAPQVERGLYYYVYSYQWFLDMINTAIASAFAAIPASLPAGAEPPYFQYDPLTERISLVAQQANYDQSSVALPIILYCNYELFRFLDGFMLIDYGTNAANGSQIQFVIEYTGDNGYTPSNTQPPIPPPVNEYLIMTQEYDTLPNWNSFSSLQIVSNLLPIVHEVVPATQNNSTTGANQGVYNSQGVLQSFEPILEFGPEARTNVQYSNPAQYHLIDLTGTTPITRVDIYIYWTDIDGNQYLLDIPIRSKATIQLMFIRKGSYYLR